MHDLLAETRGALLRLERAPEDSAALPHVLSLVRRVREACGPLSLLGAEQAARATEHALSQAERGVLAVTPDLITSLLRMLDQVETAVAGFPDPGATGIMDALGNAPSRPGGAASLPSTPLFAWVIEVAGTRFAVPRTSVVAVRQPSSTREGLPLVRLRDLLRLPSARREHADACVVVATSAGAVGLVADRVLDAEEAVMRPIAPMLHRSTMFSGSAILGSGEVVMVLDPDAVADAAEAGTEPPAALPTLAEHPNTRVKREWPPPERACGAGRPRVLLVEEGGPAPPARIRQASRFRPWWAARASDAP